MCAKNGVLLIRIVLLRFKTDFENNGVFWTEFWGFTKKVATISNPTKKRRKKKTVFLTRVPFLPRALQTL